MECPDPDRSAPISFSLLNNNTCGLPFKKSTLFCFRMEPGVFRMPRCGVGATDFKFVCSSTCERRQEI